MLDKVLTALGSVAVSCYVRVDDGKQTTVALEVSANQNEYVTLHLHTYKNAPGETLRAT